MPRLTESQWEEVREFWYGTQYNNSEICRIFGISEPTLRSHAKKYWDFPRKKAQDMRGKDPVVTPAPTPSDVTVTTNTTEDLVVDEVTISANSGELPPVKEFTQSVPEESLVPATGTEDLAAELKRERALRMAAEVRAQEAEAEVGKFKPWVEVDLYDTVEEVLELIGTGRLKELVARDNAALNRQRTLDGLDRYVLTEEEMDVAVRDKATEILARRTAFEDENPHRTRVLKVVKKGGNMVQIGAENQINNMAGSRSDWYTLYTDRGAKILVDRKSGATLCGSLNCWRVATKDSRGNYTHMGYCSEGHMRWVEGNKTTNPALTPVGAGTTGREITRTGLER